MKIASYTLDIRREPLTRPFAFKGGAYHEKWIPETVLTDAAGRTASGTGGYAVLWSDSGLFARYSEVGGNVMFALATEEASRQLVGREIDSPPHVLEDAVARIEQFMQRATGGYTPRRTACLNAYVSVDAALWLLRAIRMGTSSFDAMLPERDRSFLDAAADEVLIAPLITYNVPPEEVRSYAQAGAVVLKVKLGQPGDQTEMLERDKERAEAIFRATAQFDCADTECGRIVYYLDANGRYEQKDTVLRLLNHLDHIGMLERTVLLEEPLPEDSQESVHDLPVAIAADESVHGADSLRRRLKLGYTAVALKPAGKSLSAILEMNRVAASSGASRFVADSTCIPELVDWNRNVAARLPAVPGLKHPFMESNGPQNLRNWAALAAERPFADAPWRLGDRFKFVLDEHFYSCGGGIFA